MTAQHMPEPFRWFVLRHRVLRFALTAVPGFFLCCAGGLRAQDSTLVVATQSGKVHGVARPSGGAEFLGIPYAQPPTGERRWREPLPVPPWNEVRDASSFGAPCAQPLLGDWNRRDAESGKEDCLFLNVMTPLWPAKERLPVMFWLHGGANEGGSAASPLYKDGTLVGHGVVLVTVNYRLGVFGFFAHPGLSRESAHQASGNYGLMDQLAALRWVHENIARFGGDPGNITVFGQSAGALDAGLLMTSPLANGLFQKVILESSSALNPNIPSLSVSEERGEKVAKLLQAPSGEQAVAYLRGLTVGELLKGLDVHDPEQPPFVGPNVDGWVLPRLPALVFAAGQQMPVPMIIGSTTREFAMPGGPDAARKMIQEVSGNLAAQGLQLYGLNDGGQGSSDPLYGPVANQWLADFLFRCPASTQAEWHNAARHATYEYQFEHAIPGQEAQGAVHSADLPYVFGYYPKHGNISGAFGEADFKLADRIESYWTNFAKHGSPNGEGLPHWPEYDGSQAFIEFTEDGSVVAQKGGLRRPQCDFHRQLLKQRLSEK